MGALADVLLSALLVFVAAAFLVWRLRSKRAVPACGVSPESPPKVILGERLARGLHDASKKAT